MHQLTIVVLFDRGVGGQNWLRGLQVLCLLLPIALSAPPLHGIVHWGVG